jgi:exodeoxyribonuclease VII small subunit
MTARRSRSRRSADPEATDRVAGSAEEAAPAFEEALERLEEIVDQLEQGDLELEASLAAFEEGVRLSRQCAGQLEAAEQRVEVLVREAGEWTTRAFDPDETGSEDEDDAAGDEG